jgi:formate dehydrogenase major subunit
MRGTPASCTTPVADGMVVRTQTPRLEKLRRGVMELYISDHPLDCLTCSANNDCELQDTAAEVGLRDVRYGYAGDNHLGAGDRHVEPLFRFRSQQVHRLFALRARLRRGAGHAWR